MLLSYELKSFGWKLGLLAMVIFGLCSQPVGAAKRLGSRDAVQIVSVCNDLSRQIALELAVDRTRLVVQATCVSEGPGVPRQETHRSDLPFAARPGTLTSVFAAQAKQKYETSVTIDGVSAQMAAIRGRDGRTCADVLARAARKSPVPRRFIPVNGQWGQSVGYMVDDQCGVLAVSLGNRVAVFSADHPISFELYGISFNLK